MRAETGGRFGRWPVILSALAAGALAAPGQAPWGLWPLTILGLAWAFWLVARAPSARGAFGRAFLAGLGHFLPVMAWIVEPFFVEPEVTGWMAPFALALMAAGMALFWAVPAWLAVSGTSRPTARVWRYALALLAFEDLRGILFTGFPWALSGHVWIGTPPDQLASLGGALLLSALTLSLSAALAVAALRWQGGRKALAGIALGLGALALAGAWGWGTARLAQPLPEGPGLTLRLVQANVPQDQKWQRDLIEMFFQRHLDLSTGESPVDLVIWPETAAPFLLDNPGAGLTMAAEAAGAPLVMGIQRRARDAAGISRYYNSLAVIGEGGSVGAVYDKHHLVPFGEYIPLIGEWARAQGWGGLAQQMLDGYTPGPGPELLDLGGAGRALPLICYEAVFPRDLRGTERPDWLLQATNDAWFGHRLGPYQHFAQARLRAVETGLPLVRAANTGISAVTDARGRVLASLPLDVTGALDAALPGALPPTPYARWGDGPWHGLLALGMLALAWAAFRRRGDGKGARQSG
ncbi:MAG: apolipoprotein N-acyltransferase [Proteobacteria bacterium]|nr:apolipoprotein N-acyltransferase [Pseudomonadota bacterium]